MGELANGCVAIGIVLLGGAALRHATTGKPAPQPRPYTQEAMLAPVLPEDIDRRVIASAEIVGQRCAVAGFANDAPVTFEIDTGDPVVADFSSGYVGKLGLNPATLHYEAMWDARFGKIAHVTLREIRIGDVVWKNPKVEIRQKWSYMFGDDETPLLGLAALNSRGIHVEVDGDTCRLTMPRSAALVR